MTRLARKLLLVAAVLAGLASTGSAQEPTMLPAPTAAPAGPAPGPAATLLANWPRPPEEPPSLFKQASAPAPYECAPLPGRYFELDPLLDPPAFPRPGLVADVEVQAIVPHISHAIVNTTQIGSNAPGSLVVPVPQYDWTVSPRVEAGYRLPSGFGEFLINYQYLRSDGGGTTLLGFPGPASMNGELQFNLSDIDYASREYTPWRYWGMKWRVGFRQVHMFYNSTITQPLSAAGATGGVVSEQGYNAYHGYGGHIGVELNRDLVRRLPGLSAVLKLDFGSTAGFIRQSVNQTFTNGITLPGAFRSDQASPSILGQLGLNYHPPGTQLDFYLGSSYGEWWNLGKFNNVALNAPGKPQAKGDLSLLSITARIAWNY